jgi:molybdate transport system ATP-binding protein
MQNVRVSYEDKVILNNFDWTVRQGENWKILGPNGSGKSTLLSLISGDHLQAYANQIRVFGSPRGEGESIWELKQKIGTVTAELQIGYRQPISAFKVVLSGFFDSIGLYRPASVEQKAIAGKWLQTLNLEYLAENDFLKLSYGQQRMILIARAMVKSPSLLILDEPCQGLDPHNRNQILKVIDIIGSGTPTQILFVTHSSEDHLNCLDYELRFLKKEDGTYEVQKNKLKSLR